MQRFSAFFFAEETIIRLFRPIRIRYSVNGAETGTDPLPKKRSRYAPPLGVVGITGCSHERCDRLCMPIMHRHAKAVCYMISRKEKF